MCQHTHRHRTYLNRCWINVFICPFWTILMTLNTSINRLCLNMINWDYYNSLRYKQMCLVLTKCCTKVLKRCYFLVWAAGSGTAKTVHCYHYVRKLLASDRAETLGPVKYGICNLQRPVRQLLCVVSVTGRIRRDSARLINSPPSLVDGGLWISGKDLACYQLVVSRDVGWGGGAI